jgi:radical SAM superfamily enzyme YgiQ (UPF0313 family)
MSEAKVLYIHPSKRSERVAPNWIDFYSFYVLFPMGVIGILNLLREEGIPVKGLNYAMEIESNPYFDFELWLKGEPEARVILIDLHWYEHCFGAIEVAGICKKVLPEVPVVLGGLTATRFAKEILENVSSVDFIIKGDAEKPLYQLVKQILNKEIKLTRIPNLSYKDMDMIVENPLTYTAGTKDMDKLDFVNLDFLQNYQLYYKYQSTEFDFVTSHWLCLGRGCKIDCSFCGGGKKAHKILADRDKIVLRSIDRVLEDIGRLYTMGIQQVSLSHDPAFLGKLYWSKFFREMKKKGVKIGIYNEFFQLPSKEFLKEFVQCAVIPLSRAIFSPLSGSEQVRRFNGKSFTNTQFFETLSFLKKYSFPVTVFFSINLPLEDNKSFENTLQMAQEILDFYPGELLNIANICHTIDPCSPMDLEPGKFFIDTNLKSFMDYYHYCQLNPFITSGEDIDKLRGFKTAPPGKRDVGKMVVKWQQFCENSFPGKSEKELIWETVNREGFLFRIPGNYSKKNEEDKTWEYGEYYNPQALADDWEQFGVEGFIFYWTCENYEFIMEIIESMCRALAEEFIFQPGYNLQIEESVESKFQQYPAVVFKCRFRYPDLETGGPIHFFVINNIDQQKIYLLVLIAEQGGVKKKEEEVIKFLEDNVLSSFRFKK